MSELDVAIRRAENAELEVRRLQVLLARIADIVAEQPTPAPVPYEPGVLVGSKVFPLFGTRRSE